MSGLFQIFIFIAFIASGFYPAPAALAQQQAAAAETSTAPPPLPPEALAPEPAPAEQSYIDDPIYKQLPPVDQEKLTEEAEYVFNYCSGRETFAYLHDCACIAAKSMQVRLNDPESKKGIVAIGDEVADACPNGPGAAGFGYDNCFKTYSNMMSYGVEDFCKCYANEFSKIYMKTPRSHMSYLRKVGVAATQICRKVEGLPNPFDNRKY